MLTAWSFTTAVSSTSHGTTTSSRAPVDKGKVERAGSVRRVPAAEIDTLVTRSVRDRLDLSEPMDDRALVGRHVARVEVQREQLLIELAKLEGGGRQGTTAYFLGRRR